MQLESLASEFFARHPDVSLAALGAGANSAALDLAPFGRQLRYYAAEREPALVERYRSANQYAFPGELALPGWVLSDLYLMPGAIGLFTCPATTLNVPLRKRLGLHADDQAIAAAYLGAPTVTPGLFIGVSLISLVPGIHAGAWIKALTLRMLRATRMRGVAQWQNPSVRVHTRMGPLRIVGPVPGTHEFRERSFVYETDLSDDRVWGEAMARRLSIAPTRRVRPDDLATLGRILDRAEEGEPIFVVPPGLTPQGEVLLHEGTQKP
jgi:hypothetical protein